MARYITLSPSEQRLKHFKGDVSAIMLICSEVITWISLAADQYFDFTEIPANQIIRNVHVKCNRLFESLTLLVSPLQALYKISLEVHQQTPEPLTNQEKRIRCLKMIRPGLFESDIPDNMSPNVNLHFYNSF